MLEVKPNKEILKIKSTFFLGFTGFQFFMMGAGILAGTILYMFLPFHPLIKSFILCIVVAIFICMAMIKINNMDLFKFLIVLLKNKRICKKPFTVEREFEKEKRWRK